MRPAPRLNAFLTHAKALKTGGHTKGYDDGLLRARTQGEGEGYARALPAAEGRPPFVLVVDVGRVIEVYAEFSQTGGTYTPFPDPRNHRIALADLAKPEVQERLYKIWTAPASLDPTRVSAQVTREVAALLAQLAKSLEGTYSADVVASYLTRSLFSMFAEDVELLPKDAYKSILKKHRDKPDTLQKTLRPCGKTWTKAALAARCKRMCCISTANCLKAQTRQTTACCWPPHR